MKLRALIFAITLGLSGTVMAQKTPFWGATAPVAFDTPPLQLKKGEFTWAPSIAPAGPILVVVSLEEQRAYAYRNNVLIGAAMVSSPTGLSGCATSPKAASSTTDCISA